MIAWAKSNRKKNNEIKYDGDQLDRSSIDCKLKLVTIGLTLRDVLRPRLSSLPQRFARDSDEEGDVVQRVTALRSTSPVSPRAERKDTEQIA